MTHEYFVERSTRPDLSTYFKVTLPPNYAQRQNLWRWFRMEHAVFKDDDPEHVSSMVEQLVIHRGDAFPESQGAVVKALGVHYADEDQDHYEILDEDWGRSPPNGLIPMAAWRNCLQVFYGSDPLQALVDSMTAGILPPEYEDGAGI